MPHVTASQTVDADIQTIWRVFLDKIENPGRYMAYVTEARVLEDTEQFIVREIVTENMSLQEKITIDETRGEVRFTLLNHPLFDGDVLHQIIPPAPDDAKARPMVVVTMDWQPKTPEAEVIERDAQADIRQNIEEATLYIKRMAEQLETQQHLQG